MRAVAEDLADEPGEDPAGTGLDEGPRSRRVHRLDLVGEGDRRADLGGQFRADGVGVRGVRRGGAVGPDGEFGGSYGRVREDLGEPFPRRGHHRAVERTGDRDAPRSQTGLHQQPYGGLDVRGGTRDHRLFGRVAIGHDDRRGCLRGAQHAFYVLGPGSDGGHGAGGLARGRQDRARALAAQLQEDLRVEGTGRAQGDQLPVAVSRGEVRVHTGGIEEGVRREARDTERGLCGPGVGEGGQAAFPGGVVECGRWVEPVGVGAAELQVVPQLGQRDHQVGEHAGPLAALAGEEEGDLGPAVVRRRRVAQTDPGRRIVVPGQDPAQPSGQLRHVTRQDRGPHRLVGGVRAASRCEREVAQAPRAAVGLGGFEDPLDVTTGGRRVLAPEQEQFGGPGIQGVPWRHRVAVRADDRMEVGPAEAERADGGEAFGGRCRPGQGAGVEGERTVLLRPGRVGPLQVQGGRLDPVVQGEGGLDEARESRGALGVPDLRLDRAEHARPGLGARVGEHLAEHGEFGTVADDRTGAVRLDETDLGGRDSGIAVGAQERGPLSFGPGCGQAEGAAVAGGADALDHAVDAVAVAFGVREPLEDHAGHALAERDAVGGVVEGPGPAGRREGVHGGEQDEVVDAVVQVGSAAQDDVAAAGDEFLAGHVERGEGGGTGRVDGVVGAAEVQPVGDPAGDDVGEHAGEGVLGQPGQLLVQAVGDLAVVRREDGTQGGCVGQVAARLRAEDDGGAGAVELPPPGAVPGVLQGAPGRLQGQQLDRLDAAEGGGRDAVAQRVEGDGGQEAAPLGGRAAGGVVHRGVPAVGRDLGDGVVSGDRVGPEGGEVGGLREHAGHADDGDVERCGGRRFGVRPGGGARGPGGEEVGGAVGDGAVQGGDGGGRRAQYGHLAGHEHPVAELPFLAHAGQLAPGGALDALAGDAQPPDVEPLQRLPHLAVGQAGRA